MAESVLPALLTLNQRLITAETVQELGFVIANDTWQVLKYRQVSVYLPNKLGKPELVAVTGLTPTKEATPFTLWLNRVNRGLIADATVRESGPISAADLSSELGDGWSEWWPQFGYFVPLVNDGKCIGSVFLVRDSAWSENEQQLINHLASYWSYCAAALANRRRPSLLKRLVRTKFTLWLLLGALISTGFIPVRLSSIAEAEIISLDTDSVSSPAAGVIETFFVEPNTKVEEGTPLFNLDRRELNNQIAVARQGVEIARADLHRAQQQSFNDQQSKAELASLKGKVREQELALGSLIDMSERMVSKASRAGLFIYSDKNDWVGKPVVTGERVGELAEENELGVSLWLPANDAIALQEGAEIKIFLQVDPLNPIEATLTQTSYQVSQSPDGIAAYYLRGELVNRANARIGLRGVAKIYGEHRSLAYWIFRRPIGGVRQWLGL